jgi:hypothetical protein
MIVSVSYRQVAVFDPAMPEPFSDWGPAHDRQGFTWRPGTASFSTLDQQGPMRVSVKVGLPPLADSTAERIIAVPFAVAKSGKIEVASIDDGGVLEAPPGDYALVFEHGVDAEAHMWAVVWLAPASSIAVPSTPRCDPAIEIPSSYEMNASPA